MFLQNKLARKRKNSSETCEKIRLEGPLNGLKGGGISEN